MLPAILASVGLVLLVKAVTAGVGAIDHPVARTAAAALGELDEAVRSGGIAPEQVAESNRHIERLAALDTEETVAALRQVNATIPIGNSLVGAGLAPTFRPVSHCFAYVWPQTWRKYWQVVRFAGTLLVRSVRPRQQPGTATMARPYLVLRNRHFHFRQSVPSDLQEEIGKKEWRKSLGTGCERIAAAKATELAAANHARIAELRARTPGDRLREALTEEAGSYPEWRRGEKRLEKPSHEWTRVEAAIDARIAGKPTPAHPTLTKADRLLAAYDVPADAKEAIEDAGGLAVLARSALADARDANRLANTAELIAPLYRASDDEELQAIEVATLNAKASIAGKRATEAESLLIDAGIPVKEQAKPKDDPTKLKAVFEAWKLAKAVKTSRSRKVKTYIDRFVDLHADLPLSAITKKAAKEYAETLTDMNLSRPTVSKHLEALRAIYSWAEAEADDATPLPSNPFKGINPPDRAHVNPPIRSYRLDELKTLLATVDSEWKDDDKRLIVWTAPYTGARLEEICQLQAEDVRKEKGVWILDIHGEGERSVKNKASRRIVPIHKKLIELGLVKQAQKANGLIFPSLKRGQDDKLGHDVSRSFTELRREKAKIKDPRLNFHSFRHTFKDACRDAGVPADMQYWICGHTGENKVAHDYGVGPSIRVRNEWIQQVDPLREWEEGEDEE